MQHAQVARGAAELRRVKHQQGITVFETRQQQQAQGACIEVVDVVERRLLP